MSVAASTQTIFLTWKSISFYVPSMVKVTTEAENKCDVTVDANVLSPLKHGESGSEDEAKTFQVVSSGGEKITMRKYSADLTTK